MRSLIKKALKKLVYMAGGFHLSRMRSDMEDALKHLTKMGVQPNTVFDVGVADGTLDLYEAYPNSHFILIEPLREFETNMAEFKSRYHVDFIVAAASDQVGMMNINVHPDLCGSSMLKEVEGEHVDGEQRTVPTIRLDELAKERKLAPPYFIKVDVQGAELSVLAGAEGILEQTDAIVLEVSLFNFFIGGEVFSDVIAKMNDYSFVVYEILDGRNRPLDGALAQVDILFVRKDSPLRKNHSYATSEQRHAQNKRIKKNIVPRGEQ